MRYTTVCCRSATVSTCRIVQPSVSPFHHAHPIKKPALHTRSLYERVQVGACNGKPFKWGGMQWATRQCHPHLDSRISYPHLRHSHPTLTSRTHTLPSHPAPHPTLTSCTTPYPPILHHILPSPPAPHPTLTSRTTSYPHILHHTLPSHPAPQPALTSCTTPYPHLLHHTLPSPPAPHPTLTSFTTPYPHLPHPHPTLTS